MSESKGRPRRVAVGQERGNSCLFVENALPVAAGRPAALPSVRRTSIPAPLVAHRWPPSSDRSAAPSAQLSARSLPSHSSARSPSSPSRVRPPTAGSSALRARPPRDRPSVSSAGRSVPSGHARSLAFSRKADVRGRVLVRIIRSPANISPRALLCPRSAGLGPPSYGSPTDASHRRRTGSTQQERAGFVSSRSGLIGT
jgi:hypothetical protein